jgi:hypothetical protein
MKTFTIFLRPNRGQDTKVAYCPALGIQASSTQGFEWAAQRVALKAKNFPRKITTERMTFETEGITLTKTSDHCYTAQIPD